MGKGKDDEPPADYEVGYGKPPKEHQFKAKSAPGAKRRRKSKKSAFEPIDISRLFAAPIAVTKGGTKVKMDPFEVALRAQVKKALKEQSLPAIKEIIAFALEFKLAKPALVGRRIGPIMHVSKHCPEEIMNKIFNHELPIEERWPMILQWGLVAVRGGQNE